MNPRKADIIDELIEKINLVTTNESTLTDAEYRSVLNEIVGVTDRARVVNPDMKPTPTIKF